MTTDWRLAWTGAASNHVWMLVVNETSVPFYTSDHPVVHRASLPGQSTGGIGIDSPGVEFFMPVSPRYGLVLLERTFFRHLEEYDGGLGKIGPEKVEQLNRLQVEQSHRHLFSSTGDFRMARQVCEENPAICDPTCSNVEITVTQSGPMSARFEARVRP